MNFCSRQSCTLCLQRSRGEGICGLGDLGEWVWEVIPCMACNPFASPKNISKPLPRDSLTKYFCPSSVMYTLADDQLLPPIDCFFVTFPPSKFSSIQLSMASASLWGQVGIHGQHCAVSGFVNECQNNAKDVES